MISEIQDYKNITSFNIDRHNKKIAILLDLKGENEPVRLEAGYSVDKDCGSIVFSGFNTSREWLTAAANNFIDGRLFDIKNLPRFIVESLL